MKLQKEKFLQIQKAKNFNMNEPLNKTFTKIKKKKKKLLNLLLIYLI